MKIIFISISVALLVAQEKLINQILHNSRGVEHSKVIGKQSNLFEIRKIDSTQKVFIIYASRNDSLMKIVSKKECASECKRIEVNGKYELKIKSLLTGIVGKRHIKGIKFNDTIIELEGNGVVWDLFVSDNLKNLCMTPFK